MAPSIVDIALFTLVQRPPHQPDGSLMPALIGWLPEPGDDLPMPTIQIGFGPERRDHAIVAATWLFQLLGVHHFVFSYRGVSGHGTSESRLFDDPSSRPIVAAYGIDRNHNEAWWIAEEHLLDDGSYSYDDPYLLHPPYPNALFIRAIHEGHHRLPPNIAEAGAAGLEDWLSKLGHIVVRP